MKKDTKMTAKQYEEKIRKLIQRIQDNTTPFIDDNPEERLIRTKKAREDFFFFAKTYFPHYINKDFGKFHHEIHRITEATKEINAIAGPRGHGKTVLLAIIKPIWKALNEQIKFFIATGDNEELASERTLSIKVEFIHNQRLINDFDQQVKEGSGEDSDFLTKSGTRFLALGWKQPIRGKLNGPNRPDYIVVDDFEGHDSHNPKIAKRKLKYVREEAYGALPIGNAGQVIWLGNLTHQHSALAMFKKVCEDEPANFSISFHVYKAILEDGTPLWPQGYTLKELDKIREAMGTLGFERHFMMNPVVEGDVFKTDWFKYYSPLSTAHGPLSTFERILTYCDPSKSAKGDYKAIITIGLREGRYYLIDLYLRKATINEMIRKMYQIDQRYDTHIYMESNFWQSILWEFIPPMEKEFGYLLPVTGIQNKINKESRIEKLQPIFEWGWIFFYNPKDSDLLALEEQLTNFPDHPNDDGPDALASAIELLKTYSEKTEYRSIAKRTHTRMF